jgi:hypothetical protein
MLNWMRDPSKVGIPTIRTGLVDLCEWIINNCGLVEPDLSIMWMYELGSFAGEAAEVFAKYFDAVHCVDPWDDPCGAPSLAEIESSFDERMKAAGNIVKHIGTASDIAPSVADGSLDFVYIDSGPHTYEGNLREIREWWPKVRSGGFLGGHDWEIPELHAADVFPGVEKSVTDFFGGIPHTYGLQIFPDTSWVVRKP